MEIRLNDCLVGSDIHFPAYSKFWLRKLIDYGIRNNVRSLILAGDTFHMDSLSHWRLKSKELSLDKELSVAREIINKLSKYFKLFLVCGNHDEIALEALNNQLDFVQWCKAMFGNLVTVTNHDHLFLISGGVRWRIAHASSYSKIKGSIAANLCHDLQENIAIGHSHNLAYGTNKTDRFQWVDLGCLCDISAFEYRNRRTGGYPQWQNGFIHIKGGKAHIVANGLF